jgi:hypothetical protein
MSPSHSTITSYELGRQAQWEAPLIIDDDSTMETVVQETVAALKEITRHIGKADRWMTVEQIKEVEDAIRLLQGALDFKKV